MWIGTPDGLNRYDGFNFLVYKNNQDDSLSIQNDYIQTILEDRDKNLLIGTERGLSLYDRKKDCFRNFMNEKSSAFNGMEFLVSKIIEDSIGNLWLATGSGLIYYDRHKNSIMHFTNDQDKSGSLSDNDVESILIDKENRFWVATRKGLNLFNRKTGIFERIKKLGNCNEDLSTKVFWNVAEDMQGDIWFGGTDGLYRFTKTNGDYNFVHYQHDVKDKSSLSINQVVSLFVDDVGNLWIGTENGGINLFDRKANRFWHYRKDENDPQSLNNESIETIYQDKTGNFWFGTYTGGLNAAIKNRDGIVSYLSLPAAPLSLSHNTVTSFLERENGQIWVSTDGGGLYLLDINNKSYDRFNIDNSHLSSNSILCIDEDSNNQIWLGTWAGGLVHLDSKTKSITSFTTRNSDIQDDNIFSVLNGNENDLWLGSFTHGLIHYQIKENKFTALTSENSGLTSGGIVKLVKFEGKRILIGTSENFQIYSLANGQFKTFKNDPTNKNSISSSKVTDILVQNDTCIWIGTPHGLNRFNPVTESFIRYYEKDGLPNNYIKGLILDNAGILWVTTSKGVSRFDYRHMKFKNLSKSDGFLSSEFSERGILKTKAGSLLAGGTKGFSIIYPEKITENKKIPAILITDFKISGKSVRAGSKNSPLIQNITETSAITLSPDQSEITFYFAAMDFSAPEKNQFAYKMEGFDKDWVFAGNKGEATYTNLNHGDYVFRVKGSNNDNTWNEAGTSVKIKILPPWWLTWWSKLFVTCFITLILTSIYFYRVSRLKKQKANLENSVAIKTVELKELNASKDKFFSIIAHDLKNPFNTIIGFSNLLNEELGNDQIVKSREYARLINVSAVQTLKLLENLLEWANSQRGKISFNPERLIVNELVKEEMLVLNDMAVEKNIELTYVIPPEFTILADKNMIRTVLRNLISNAIKFTHRNGRVEVKAFIIYDKVEIVVRDNGIGMSKAAMAQLFKIDADVSTRGTENEKGTGLGLFLCKEFVEKHGGTISAESQQGVGSVFIVTLPSGAIKS
jgi:signal transduction histidine kinase/ligand-binding sensor domain-containing protein